MPTVDVLDLEGRKIEDIVLPESVFGIEHREYLFHTAIRVQLASKRRGTACTKTRAEVRAGGRKPWRQKGTGRARSGSRSSPLWRGGGVVHGPKPRDYYLSLPKKVKKAAVRSALSLKLCENKLLVLSEFSLAETKTKAFTSVMTKLNLHKPLIVFAGSNPNLQHSARNVPGVKVLRVDGLNVYDVLNHEHLILVKDSIPYIEKVYA